MALTWNGWKFQETNRHPRVREGPLFSTVSKILDKKWCFQNSFLRVWVSASPHKKLIKNLEFYSAFEKHSAGLSKKYSTCPEEHFGKNIFFFEFLAKMFWTGSEKILAGLSKLHSTCPVEHFGYFFEREHAHSELVNQGGKSLTTEEKIFLSLYIRSENNNKIYVFNQYKHFETTGKYTLIVDFKRFSTHMQSMFKQIEHKYITSLVQRSDSEEVSLYILMI